MNYNYDNTIENSLLNPISLEEEFVQEKRNRSSNSEDIHGLVFRKSVDLNRSHHSSVASYLPDPDDAATRPSILKSVAGYIIVTNFCESVAFYGFGGSLVLFFQVSSILLSDDLLHLCLDATALIISLLDSVMLL